MNDKLNFIDERQKRRYEKVLQKTGEEYLQEIAILKSREDFLEEYEYLEADLNPAERVPEKNPSASFLISMAATDPLKFESVITF